MTGRDVLVPVFDRFARGYPEHQEPRDQDVAAYASLREVLTMECPLDAHFAAYSQPSIPRRLAGEGALEVGASMVLAAFDVDRPKTAEREAWYHAQGEALRRLLAAHPGGFVYTTRGGLRIVYSLPQPIAIDGRQAAERWTATYLRWCDHLSTFGIEADRACKDWTRIFRLPRVVRDGEKQEPETYGDPAEVGVWDVAIDEIPASAEPAPAPAPAKVEKTKREYGPAEPGLLAAAWERLERHGPAVQGKGGDDHTFQAAAILVKDYALAEEEAWPLLLRWNLHCDPPWDEAELSQKLKNGQNHGHGVYGEMREAFATQMWFEENFPTPQAEAEPEWKGLLAQAQADLDAYRGALPGTGGGKHARPAFSPAADLLDAHFPPTPWLVRGLVVEQGVGVTSAEPKSCKTWVELELALAIATGTKALGEFETGTPRGVGLFLAEDHARSAKNRLRSLAAARGMDPREALARLHICCRQHLDLTNDGDLVWLIASCRTIPDLAVIVIDPLRNVHTAEENDSTGMADVMGRLRTIRDIVGCAVRVPHHAKKDSSSSRGGQNMRGSSAIHGALDCGLFLDGLDTDGRSRWSVKAEAEIKAAQGAGTFQIELVVEDDAAGEAVRATWKVERSISSSKRAKAQDAIEEKIVEIVQALDTAMGPLSRDKLFSKVKGGRPKFDAALELADQRSLVARHFIGNKSSGLKLTDAGRRYLQEPAAPPPDPNSPIAAFLPEGVR